MLFPSDGNIDSLIVLEDDNVGTYLPMCLKPDDYFTQETVNINSVTVYTVTLNSTEGLKTVLILLMKSENYEPALTELFSRYHPRCVVGLYSAPAKVGTAQPGDVLLHEPSTGAELLLSHHPLKWLEKPHHGNKPIGQSPHNNLKEWIYWLGEKFEKKDRTDQWVKHSKINIHGRKEGIYILVGFSDATGHRSKYRVTENIDTLVRLRTLACAISLTRNEAGSWNYSTQNQAGPLKNSEPNSWLQAYQNIHTLEDIYRKSLSAAFKVRLDQAELIRHQIAPRPNESDSDGITVNIEAVRGKMLSCDSIFVGEKRHYRVRLRETKTASSQARRASYIDIKLGCAGAMVLPSRQRVKLPLEGSETYVDFTLTPTMSGRRDASLLFMINNETIHTVKIPIDVPDFDEEISPSLHARGL